MIKRYLQLHRLTLTLDLKWDRIAGKSANAEQICKFDLAIEGIDIVPVLIDFVVSNSGENITNLQAGLHSRRIRLNTCDINARRLSGLAGVISQLRVAAWGKGKATRWETAIVLGVSLLQELRNAR